MFINQVETPEKLRFEEKRRFKEKHLLKINSTWINSCSLFPPLQQSQDFDGSLFRTQLQLERFELNFQDPGNLNLYLKSLNVAMKLKNLNLFSFLIAFSLQITS